MYSTFIFKYIWFPVDVKNIIESANRFPVYPENTYTYTHTCKNTCMCIFTHCGIFTVVYLQSLCLIKIERSSKLRGPVNFIMLRKITLEN